MIIGPIGHILRSSRTGLVFVPFEEAGSSSYNCVVVDPGSEPANQKSYPVGGYNICVSRDEIEMSCDRVGVPAPRRYNLANESEGVVGHVDV